MNCYHLRVITAYLHFVFGWTELHEKTLAMTPTYCSLIAAFIAATQLLSSGFASGRVYQTDDAIIMEGITSPRSFCVVVSSLCFFGFGFQVVASCVVFSKEAYGYFVLRIYRRQENDITKSKPVSQSLLTLLGGLPKRNASAISFN